MPVSLVCERQSQESKDAYRCVRKMEYSSCGRENLRTGRRRISVGGEPLNEPSTRLSEPGPPVRPLKEKESGPFGELCTSNPGSEVPRRRRLRQTCLHEEWMMLTTGDEVAQRVASDAESVVGDELREPRRRNSLSDPTSREMEDHVMAGHASFRSCCAAW